MKSEYSASLYLIAGLCTALAVGFMFPPLTTSRGGPPVPDAEQVSTAQERAFCQNNLAAVNCRCFAKVAGHVQADERPRVSGFNYIAKDDLARAQAKQTC